MRFRRRRSRENVEINLASLIDVVFILLLFFIVTTTFKRETQLQVDLPEADNAAAASAPGDPLEITIAADGHYALNGQVLARNDLAGLQAALQRQSGGDTRQPVTISADANTPHQAVVSAMDVAGKLGFAHLRITTVPPEEAP